MRQTTRRGAIALVTSIAVVLVCTTCRGTQEQADTPIRNLLFISIDTLRADHLGLYGYPRPTSPNIDRIAERSIVFRNFFTSMPKTGPAMTTLFTGKYPQHHRVTQNTSRVRSQETMLAELLPSEFLKGALVANPTLSAERGYAAGFDDFQVTGGDTVDLTDRALSWLEHHEQRRFFLWLHYLDPHGPYLPPERLRERFVGDAFYDDSRRVPLDYEPQPGLNPNYVLGAVPGYQRLGDHDVVDYYIAQYDAEIVLVDEQVGRILAFLETRGLSRNTLIVLTSDHGESLGEHGYYFEHGMLVNEGSIAIPLILHHPALGQRVVDGLVQNTDVLPMLLRQLGLEVPQELDGMDPLDPPSGSSAGSLRDYVYACTPYPGEYPTFFEAIRTTEGKLVRSGRNDLVYYDLARDPRESENSVSSLDPLVLRGLVAALDGFGRAPLPSEPPPQLPDALQERLRSRGYVE